MTDRISDIALQAARDFIAENGGEIGWIDNPEKPGFVIKTMNPKAFLAAIGHAVLATRPHQWKDHPEVVTTPVNCFLCGSPAAVVIYAPNGCTCSPNKYQPRCHHHLMRACDTQENFTIVEDFMIPLPPSQSESQ